jgi:hypothetical protein
VVEVVPDGNRAPCRRACPGFYLISYRNFAPDNPAKLDDRLLGRSPESRHVAVQADFIKRRITIIRSLGRPGLLAESPRSPAKLKDLVRKASRE